MTLRTYLQIVSLLARCFSETNHLCRDAMLALFFLKVNVKVIFKLKI